MSRIPWWGWAAAFIVVGYVFVKWYSNQSANASASNPYLNPATSTTPFDNGVQSDLSTATVQELLQLENQINGQAAGNAATVAGTGTSMQPFSFPFLTGPHGQGPTGPPVLVPGGGTALRRIA